MMEKIRKLNLDVALFVKELNSYIKNVDSGINDETIKLLIETIESVNKLQKISKFHEKTSTNESSFINNLNDDIFKCRPYIVCCLCHEQFPLTTEDYNIHISKRSHKEKETEQQSHNQYGLASNLIQINPSVSTIPENNTNNINSTNDDQSIIAESDSSDSSVCVIKSNANDGKCVVKAVEIPKTQSTADGVTNVIDPEEFSRNIGARAVDLIFRSVQRISLELKILDLLSCHLKGFDSTLQTLPFGSATYGFGGTSSDFNILVIAPTDVWNKNSHEAFEQFIKASGIQTDFQVLETIHGDRAQNRRLQAAHKSSGILCRIHFDLNFETAKSSQIIRNCILYSPLCYHLIVYIKSWQNALIDSTSTNDFQFNTYIISVLVIFCLQMNNQFPKLADVPATETKFIDHVPHLEKEKFKLAVVQFFKFYSSQYQIKNHVISVDIGRWKNRIIESNQTNITPEEERLKVGIESNPHNWENCTMYVQDLVAPGVNITAEIKEEEANNFRNMCKVFTSTVLHDKTIDEYCAKVSEEISTFITITLSDNISSKKKPANELRDKPLIPIPKGINATTNLELSTMSIFNNNAGASLKSATIKNLDDIIKVNTVTEYTKIEMNEILSRSKSRIEYEQGIMKILSFFVTTYDSTIKLTPFGSVTYGFGGMNTNFNIFINSVSTTFGKFQIILESLLKTSDPFKKEFKLLKHVKPNRVQSEQMVVHHINSSIQCNLQFATKPVLLHVEQTKKIILDYLKLYPLCKKLIAYVKAWQNMLNKEASKHGLMVFNMNTYIITVLVIFYLQMNHKLPKVKDLASVISNKSKFSINSDLGQLIKGFFEFYGKSFNCNTHIISIHVGRWQQKEQVKQKHATAEQKSMRAGIKAFPKNWQNCTMWVQDIVSSQINITAEISKQEIDNFVRMCQIFAEHKPKFDDGSKSVLTKLPKPISSQSNTPFLPTFDSVKTNCTAFIKLLNKEVSRTCLPSTMEQRQRFEREIFSTIESFLHEFDSSLKLYAFGSSQYSVKLPGSNYNLVIVTTSPIKTLKIATQLFLLKFGQSNISCCFNGLNQIAASRVMSSQISMIHVKSGITCIITFEKDQTIIESTKIIARFTKDPTCNVLISFLRLLLDALQRSSIMSFEFNTYIISILVIFFLQVEYNYHTVEQITQGQKICSKSPKFETAIKHFFKFYGKRYQIKNHVISANIGQWQERHSQPKQKPSTTVKNRLRTGISNSPENWKNCTMFVQDLVRPHINATAEISKIAAENFQMMCETFSNAKF